MTETLKVNALIMGGGIAGLWTLDSLVRAGGSAVLVEAHRLGGGQTIASQGILHSGLKYSLAGVLTSAAREASAMPALWRRCLDGSALPDLSAVHVSSESFHLWGTQDAASRIGLLGARIGLKVTPQRVPQLQLPSPLAECAGAVYRVDEQVLDPCSLVTALAAPHRDRILQIDPVSELEFEISQPGVVRSVRLHAAKRGLTVVVEPDVVILTAGKGNELLRSRVGLLNRSMQLRPLHYVLVRGRLPMFHGHCIDFNRTRVSITSSRDSAGRTVWQVGGQISEDGVALDSERLIAHTQSELRAVLPGVDFSGTQWSTCRIDRAEGASLGGSRPDSYRLIREGNVLTGWPTKLVLAPLLARAITTSLNQAELQETGRTSELLRDWPHPPVAHPAWEETRHWEEHKAPVEQRRAA